MHQCADAVRLDEEPARYGLGELGVALAAVLFLVGFVGQLTFGEMSGGERWALGVVALLFGVFAVRVFLRLLRPSGRIRTARVFRRHCAATLCPHGVGVAGQLLDWDELADIRVSPAGKGPAFVAARLRPGAAGIGLPPARELVDDRAAGTKTDWVWLGRVPADRVRTLADAVKGWRTNRKKRSKQRPSPTRAGDGAGPE
jgi:hypothetical protein